jgi:hypothetical protein
MSVRDEFREEVKLLLAKRAGFRCSNPNCRQPTAGPTENPHRSSNIGVAAHITAAAAGGPRFDPMLSSEVRRSAENGIWLCQNHAKLVDGDDGRYTVEYLREWKRFGEEAARLDLESPGSQRLRPELRLQVEHIKLDTQSPRIFIPVRNFGQTIAHKVSIKFDCDQTAVHNEQRQEDIPPDGKGYIFYFDFFLPVPQDSEIGAMYTKLISSIRQGAIALVFTIDGYYFGDGIKYDIPERYGIWSIDTGLQITLSQSAAISNEA